MTSKGLRNLKVTLLDHNLINKEIRIELSSDGCRYFFGFAPDVFGHFAGFNTGCADADFFRAAVYQRSD